MTIKKGDTVLVTKGKDRLKSGRVVSVYPASNKAVVEGVNIYKKNVKPSKKYPQGGIIDKTVPVSANNLMIICQACKQPVRVSFKGEGKDKKRICRKCGEVLDAS